MMPPPLSICVFAAASVSLRAGEARADAAFGVHAVTAAARLLEDRLAADGVA